MRSSMIPATELTHRQLIRNPGLLAQVLLGVCLLGRLVAADAASAAPQPQDGEYGIYYCPGDTRKEVFYAPLTIRDGRAFSNRSGVGGICAPAFVDGHAGWTCLVPWDGSEDNIGNSIFRWYHLGDALLGYEISENWVVFDEYSKERQKDLLEKPSRYSEPSPIFAWRKDARTPKDSLAYAQAEIAARRPKEALVVLQSIIEFNRREVALTVPAVQSLVQAFQLLKDQRGMPQVYQDIVSRYLTKVPPLDGSSLPTAQEATEDLRWKPWKSWLTATQDQASRPSAAQGRFDGLLVSATAFREKDADGIKILVRWDGEAFNNGPGNRPEFTAECLGQPTLGEVAVTVASPADGGQSLALAVPGHPATGSTLPQLSMTLRAKQAISTSQQRIELKPGANIGVGHNKCIVESLTQVDGIWKLIVTVVKGTNTPWPDTSNIFDAEGNRAKGCGGHGDGKVMILNFNSKSKPAYYLVTTVDAWATRDIPISLDHIVVR
jgi:hypothetical protein